MPCVGIFQASLEILADHLEDLWLSVQEIGNFLEILVHVDALANELEIGKGELVVGGSCHRRLQMIECTIAL